MPQDSRVLERIVALASDGCLNKTKLEFVVSRIGRWSESELEWFGNAFVRSVLYNGHSNNTFYPGETAIYNEKRKYICSAPFLPYMSEFHTDIYAVIVRRSAELDEHNGSNLMAIVRREWNPALNRLVPSRYAEFPETE